MYEIRESFEHKDKNLLLYSIFIKRLQLKKYKIYKKNLKQIHKISTVDYVASDNYIVIQKMYISCAYTCKKTTRFNSTFICLTLLA